MKIKVLFPILILVFFTACSSQNKTEDNVNNTKVISQDEVQNNTESEEQGSSTIESEESENDTEAVEEDINPSSNWAKGYYECLKKLGEDYAYIIIDVNGDDIPELVCCDKEYGYVYSVITYSNDNIDILKTDDAFMDYVEGKNFLQLYYPSDTHHVTDIYSINDGKWEKIATEEGIKIEEYKWDYYWNGQLTEKPDFGTINPYYDSSELMKFLAQDKERYSLAELKIILYKW